LAALVRTLEQLGFKTCDAGRGRGWAFLRPPYVAFEATEASAARLSRLLRDDSEAALPRLYWGWGVEAEFDEAHRLRYCITVENPGRPWYRWARWWVDQDLRRMPTLLFDGMRTEGERGDPSHVVQH
jgi:hypothetical protein